MASQGDPRVLFVLNLVLSGLFSLVVVSGLAFITAAEFTWGRVAVSTAALMVLTWLFVLRD